MPHRRLCLAVVQMACANRRATENLASAGHWASLAAEQGAHVVLLPELFSTGAELNALSWQIAEPQHGQTENWLVHTAARHDILIGGSYLERRGHDIFNTFALAGPDGIAGRVSKRHPCSLESTIVRGEDGSHVIATPLGRFGVAICYDSTRRDVWDRLLAEAPDVVLMPMSLPTPPRSPWYGPRRIEAFQACFRDSATRCATMFGLPCAMSNKWGQWDTTLPGLLPPLLFARQRPHYPGFSHIADGNGREIARIRHDEGLALARVTLDRSRVARTVPPACDRFHPWILDVPAEFRLFDLVAAMGRRWSSHVFGGGRDLG